MKLEISKSHFPMLNQHDRSASDPVFNFPPNLIELTLTNFNFQKDIHLISAINKKTLRTLILIKPQDLNPDFLESLTTNYLINLTFIKLVDLNELLERFDSSERTEFYGRMAHFIEKKNGKIRIEVEYPMFKIQKGKFEVKEQEAIKRILRQMRQPKITMDMAPLFNINTIEAFSDAINQIGTLITYSNVHSQTI